MPMSTGAQDLNVARNWLAMSEIKRQIDLEIVPVAINLGIEDPRLFAALEELSEAIGAHFERFRLVAETRPKSKQPFEVK